MCTDRLAVRARNVMFTFTFTFTDVKKSKTFFTFIFTNVEMFHEMFVHYSGLRREPRHQFHDMFHDMFVH
jgi:hypothetical protein